MKEPIFDYNEETGITVCHISDNKNNTFTGIANCHDDDRDFMSRLTGCEIAFRRAKIEQLRFIRENDLKPRLAALEQLYYSMNRSSQFDEKSYPNRMLQRQIRLIKFDLTTINEMLAYERQGLKSYISQKDDFYKKTRKMRAGQK